MSTGTATHNYQQTMLFWSDGATHKHAMNNEIKGCLMYSYLGKYRMWTKTVSCLGTLWQEDQPWCLATL